MSENNYGIEIGSASYGGEFKRKEYFKIKDGAQVYRILPPLGSQAKLGRWSVYYATHFGYRNQDGKMRTFASPERTDFKTRAVLATDMALDRIRKADLEFKKAKETGNEAAMEALSEFKKTYSLDRKHYMNAMTLDGTIGLLKLPSTAHKMLKAEIDLLRAKGVDPLSVDNGRFFVITRTGKGRDTQYKVTVYQEPREIEGSTGYFDKVSKLGSDVLSRLKDEAFDLGTLYRTPSSEEVARIVSADMAGDRTVLDSVLEIGSEQSEQSSSASSVASSEEDDLPVETTPTAVVAQTPSESAPAAATAKTEPVAPADFLKSLEI